MKIPNKKVRKKFPPRWKIAMSIKAPYKKVYVFFPFINYVIWWHKMTKGEVGVWNGPKKDDVIYEQPLSGYLKKFWLGFLILLKNGSLLGTNI